MKLNILHFPGGPLHPDQGPHGGRGPAANVLFTLRSVLKGDATLLCIADIDPTATCKNEQIF